MYENATYDFYTNILKRKVIPSVEIFDSFKMLNVAFMDQLKQTSIITEYQANGIDISICMMCEVDYVADKAMTGTENSGRVSSASVGGVSESYDKSYANAIISQNIKPVEVQKLGYIKMFCHVYCGVR